MRARYEFGTIWVAGNEELIDLKKLAGREQDLIAIRALREANEDAAPRAGDSCGAHPAPTNRSSV